MYLLRAFVSSWQFLLIVVLADIGVFAETDGREHGGRHVSETGTTFELDEDDKSVGDAIQFALKLLTRRCSNRRPGTRVSAVNVQRAPRMRMVCRNRG